MPTPSSRAERSPDARESAIFLELAEQVFDRFRPDVLLTYGGHPASLELMRRARQRGCRCLPSAQLRLQGSQGLCRRLNPDLSVGILAPPPCPAAGPGRPCHPRPDPARPHRRRDAEPKYVTFINPQPSKGMAVFADCRRAERAPAGQSSVAGDRPLGSKQIELILLCMSSNSSDHWPHCYSVVLAGGGIRGGTVFGSTDKLGAYPETDPITPADLAATLFWRFGLDPRKEMSDLTGRPYKLADGQPIDGLFA